jgi:hypothetical protein
MPRAIKSPEIGQTIIAIVITSAICLILIAAAVELPRLIP